MNEELEEQASLYAFDLLEGAEHAAFEARLTSDDELRAQVNALREAAALSAHAAPLRQPPAHLEAKILNAIRGEVAVQRPAASSSVWMPWALAACLALGLVILLADRAQTQKQIARLEQRNAFAQLRIATLSSQLQSAPDATAAVVWDETKQEGVLKVSNVPANADDRDYQIWIVDPDYENPVDGGTFHMNKEGATDIPFKARARVSKVNAFAVSLERRGGVPKAEGPMVLLGK